MPTNIRFPRGTTYVIPLAWASSGTPIDLSSATFVAYLKRCLFDEAADALEELTHTVLDATAGLSKITFLPADTEEVDPFQPLAWHVRATLADGRVVEPETHSGAVALAPVGDPADYPEPTTMSELLRNLPGLTALTGGTTTSLDGVPTADGATITGTVAILSYDLAQQDWKLVAGTDAEDAAAGVVRPDDYNAVTNARVWKQIS